MPPRLTDLGSGGGPVDIDRAPLEDLLPSSGSLVPAPAPAPARVLALDALRLLRSLQRAPSRRGRSRPAHWFDASFATQVDTVRAHLAPVVGRRALVDSFAREACQHDSVESPDDREAVRLAYALAWLELGDGVVRADWLRLLEPPPA